MLVYQRVNHVKPTIWTLNFTLKRKEDVMINHIAEQWLFHHLCAEIKPSIHRDKVGVPIVPGDAGKLQKGKQRPLGMPVRCRSGEGLILLGASANEQMAAEMIANKMPWNQWHESNGARLATQLTAKCPVERVNERMNEWNELKWKKNLKGTNKWNDRKWSEVKRNETQWLTEWKNVSEWTGEGTKWNETKGKEMKGMNEWMDQPISEPVSPWRSEGVNQWTIQWSEWMSDFFAEYPFPKGQVFSNHLLPSYIFTEPPPTLRLRFSGPLLQLRSFAPCAAILQCFW